MTFLNNLKGYEIRFLIQAKKDLDKLDKKTVQKITQKLKELVTGSQNLDIIADKIAAYRSHLV
jgi:mRNA-degrading endonuclease RelE of RelBE toxin-antitoxin system